MFNVASTFKCPPRYTVKHGSSRIPGLTVQWTILSRSSLVIIVIRERDIPFLSRTGTTVPSQCANPEALSLMSLMTQGGCHPRQSYGSLVLEFSRSLMPLIHRLWPATKGLFNYRGNFIPGGLKAHHEVSRVFFIVRHVGRIKEVFKVFLSKTNNVLS